MGESEATRVFKQVDGELNTAQHQWNSYADVIGSGYTRAYERHEQTLDEIFRARMAGAEIFYFLLSGLAVGYAGGFAGALMAPWIERAGDAGASKFLTEIVRGVGQEEAKRAAVVPAKWLEHAHPRSGGGFKPVMKSPLSFYQDMKSEIGLCFSRVRDHVTEFKTFADENKLPAYIGDMMLNLFRARELLKDQPKTDEMSVKGSVAFEAEIAMWIAWAKAFDASYWRQWAKLATDRIVSDSSNLPTYSLKEFDPIFSRLKTLGVAHHVTMFAEPAYSPVFLPIPRRVPAEKMTEKVLDIMRVRSLGNILATPFLSKVSGIIENPAKVLPEMASLRPVYKKRS